MARNRFINGSTFIICVARTDFRTTDRTIKRHFRFWRGNITNVHRRIWLTDIPVSQLRDSSRFSQDSLPMNKNYCNGY